MAGKFLGFAAVVLGLLATFVIEATLINGTGDIESVVTKVLYNTIFFACPILIIVNVVKTIFPFPVFSKSIKGSLLLMLFLLDVSLFQSFAIFGLGDEPNFQALYLKHFVLLQGINLLFFWAFTCGLVGQDRFHPFFRDFMKDPFVIFYWIGYGATQVGQDKKTRKKR